LPPIMSMNPAWWNGEREIARCSVFSMVS
jgi:hypothetical protein